MFRSLLFAGLLGVAAASSADGPGTRILASPTGPQRPVPAAERDLQRCEAMRTQARERCMKEVRAAVGVDGKARGPEAAGAGPSAGSGATAGASGGGTSGSGAPR